MAFMAPSFGGTDGVDPAMAVVEMVWDISPGEADASPTDLTSTDTNLFFTALEPNTGIELWATDGTLENTRLVNDVNPNGNSQLSQLTAVADLVFFTADDGVHGTELWVSDGTEAGTTRLTDANPGFADADPGNLIAVGNSLFFTAFDPITGIELWKSDGFGPGTAIVKDINTTDSSSPSDLAAAGSSLCFVADDGLNGRDLWKTDGTAENTLRILAGRYSDRRRGGSFERQSGIRTLGVSVA